MVKEGINEIISKIDTPQNSKILDIGCFGRQGINTSSTLVDEFYTHGEIDGLNLNNLIPEEYPNINLIQQDYFNFNTNFKYNLICADLGGLGQLHLIEEDITGKLYNILKKDGILIFYTFVSNNYTSFRTEIKNHLQNYWSWVENSPMDEKYIFNKCSKLYSNYYNIISVDVEQVRPYLAWVVLKKI